MSNINQLNSSQLRGPAPDMPGSPTATGIGSASNHPSTPPPSLRITPATTELRSQAEFFITGMVPTGPQNGDECGICTDSLVHDVVQITVCGHKFHTTCILPWLQDSGANNRTCPYCRRQLFLAPTPEHAVSEAHAGQPPVHPLHMMEPSSILSPEMSPAQHEARHLARMHGRRRSVDPTRPPVASGVPERAHVPTPRARSRRFHSRITFTLRAGRTSGAAGLPASGDLGPDHDLEILEEALSGAFRSLFIAQDVLDQARTACAFLESRASSSAHATSLAVNHLADAIMTVASAEDRVACCLARLRSY